MNRKLKILCDVDGVVANMLPEWLNLYNFDYSDNICVEDITEWGLHKLVKCGTKIYEYLWLTNLYDHVRPFAGAVEGIRAIRSMGHRVIFLTSGLQPAKIEWLNRQSLLDSVLWRSDPDWIIASDKSLFEGDIMIDDYLKNLDGFKGFPIVFDAPYNRTNDQYLRVKTWFEIVKFISEEI